MTRPIHPEVRIGHVHLTVSNLDRALKFYRDALGFEVTQRYGESAAFLSAGPLDAQVRQFTAADYDRAVRMLGPNLAGLVRGGSVSGVVFDAFARARLSLETTVRGRLRGPRAVRLDDVQITGA